MPAPTTPPRHGPRHGGRRCQGCRAGRCRAGVRRGGLLPRTDRRHVGRCAGRCGRGSARAERRAVGPARGRRRDPGLPPVPGPGFRASCLARWASWPTASPSWSRAGPTRATTCGAG